MAGKLIAIFLGIIAAVLVGGAVIWWSGQPSAEDQRRAQGQEALERLRDSTRRLEEVGEACRAAGC